MLPAFPGTPPSGRWQFPRLQLRGSAGFPPASLSSPSGKDARSERSYKEQKQPYNESNGENHRSQITRPSLPSFPSCPLWLCLCTRQRKRSSPPSPQNIQHNRQHHAQQHRSRQRKINSRTLPAIYDVPRQPSQRQVRPPQQSQRDSRRHQHHAEDDQHLSQISHWIPASTDILRDLPAFAQRLQSYVPPSLRPSRNSAKLVKKEQPSSP